jgi:hypothetical protein
MARGKSQDEAFSQKRRGRPPKSKTAVADLSSCLTKIEKSAIDLSEMSVPQPYIYVGMDQRSTKNLGNFETFVFGFSLTMPTPFEPGDDLSKEGTRSRLKKKYEDVSNFISDLMRSVEGQVDVAQDKIATPPTVEVVNPPAAKPSEGNQSTLVSGVPPGSQDKWPPRPTWGPQGTTTIIKANPPPETPPSSESAF